MTGATKWTEEKDHLLITNWSTMSVLGLEELLGIEKSKIHHRATYWRKIGVNLSKKTGKIDEDCRRPKQQPDVAPIEQNAHVGWIGSAEWKARRMGGR